MNSPPQLLSLLERNQNCLILAYTHISSEATESEQWAAHLVAWAMIAGYPLAYYSRAANKTGAVQCNINCKLFLIYLGTVRAPCKCERLLTSSIPLAGEATAKNELVIYLTIKGSGLCMHSAVLLKQDMDYIQGVSHVRTNVLFLRVTFLTAVYMARFESSLLAPAQDDGIKTFIDLIGQGYRIRVKYRIRTYVMLMDFPEANAFRSLPHT